MYTGFYGLSERPFSLLPDPDYLYLSKEHSIALAVLEYALTCGVGCAVVTGDVGCGKTTLVRQILNGIGNDLTVGLISNTHRSFGELLDWVSLAFNLDVRDKRKPELYYAFVEFMIRQFAEGKRTVLIVDEAQNMDAQTLEELRLLTNVNADKDQMLQLVLVGQPELRETMQRPDMLQFVQRVGANFHLEPLQLEEVPAYIRHRLFVAGGKPDIFEAAACAAIAEHSGGVPRVINTLCDTALVYGFAANKTHIDLEMMEEVFRDRNRNGLLQMAVEKPALKPASGKSPWVL